MVCVVGAVFLFCFVARDSTHDATSIGLLSVGGPLIRQETSRRRFIKYTPSLWEQLWLDNIHGWEKERLICKKLKSEAQFPFVRAFMKTTCTYQYEGTPWCIVDDGTGEKRRFWFNLDTGKVARDVPTEPPPSGFKTWQDVFASRNAVKPFAPEELESGNEVPMVFSRFDFVDDITGNEFSEYIEPLVSHLRHPLSACYQKASYTTRAYIIPPTNYAPAIDSKSFTLTLAPHSGVRERAALPYHSSPRCGNAMVSILITLSVGKELQSPKSSILPFQTSTRRESITTSSSLPAVQTNQNHSFPPS